MCGIWFSAGFEPTRDVIDVVAHRGPDGSGWVRRESAAGPIVIGHRRLAVRDPSSRGEQPMTTPDGRFWITFNGELYNFRQLRSGLERRGHSFRSNTDTEVLLTAYAERGAAILDELAGMFAFVIWDDRDKVAFAARDRFGVKPLYFHAGMRGVCFASEAKQILELQGIRPRLNADRAVDFLAAGATDHDRATLFDGIQTLRGGECVTLDLRGSAAGLFPELLPRRWYDLPRPSDAAMPICEAAGRLRMLLESTVEAHTQADAKVGLCLSGGLDSASLASLMAVDSDGRRQADRFATFSACFEDEALDERPFLDAVLEKTGLPNNRLFARPEETLALVDRVVWNLDEPFGGTSAVVQWQLFALARHAGVKVTLSGQGADEQFGGYELMVATRRAQLARRRELLAARSIWARQPAARSAASSAWPAFIAQDARSERPLPFTFDTDTHSDLGLMCNALITAGSLPMLLRLEDRNSMAHSIESRVPFLDHAVVEFTTRLGSEHKIAQGFTKFVLRRALEDRLPRAVLLRKTKIGFSSPEERWLRGPMRNVVAAGARTTAKVWPGLLDAVEVDRLIDRSLHDNDETPLHVWRMFCFGRWAERFDVT